MEKILGLICLYCVACPHASAENCTNTELSRDLSPNQYFETVLYTRICDESSVASTQISVLIRNEALIAEDIISVIYSTLSYPEYIKVEWISGNKIKITEDKDFSPMTKADGTFLLDKTKNVVYTIDVEYQ